MTWHPSRNAPLALLDVGLSSPRRWVFRATGMIISVVGVLGCQPLPICEPGAKAGRVYAMRLLSKETIRVPGSSWKNGPTCEGFDGLIVGTTVSMRMTGYREGDHCRGAIGEVVLSPNPSRRTPGPVTPGGPAILTSYAQVENPGCFKSEHLELLAHPENRGTFLSTPIPGAPPPALLHRTSQPRPGAPECLPFCEDLFGVSVEESQ